MYSTIFEPVKLSVVFNVTQSGVIYIYNIYIIN